MAMDGVGKELQSGRGFTEQDVSERINARGRIAFLDWQRKQPSGFDLGIVCRGEQPSGSEGGKGSTGAYEELPGGKGGKGGKGSAGAYEELPGGKGSTGAYEELPGGKGSGFDLGVVYLGSTGGKGSMGAYEELPGGKGGKGGKGSTGAYEELPSGSTGGKGGQDEQPIGSSVGSTGGKGEQPSGSKVAENAAGEVAARRAVEEAENGKGKGSSNRLGGAGKNKIIYELKGEEEIRAAVKASVSKAKYVINGNGDSWCMV